MPPKLSAVFFDLDGVLVDSIAAWESLLVDAIEHFGGRALRPGEFRAVFGQSAAAERDTFFPGLAVEELDRFYREHFARRAGLVRVGEGAAEALAACRALDLRLAVVTNTDGSIARAVLAAADLLHRVETVVGADEVANPKPAPDMVHEAASRLGVRAEEAVVVGDSRYDAAAARAAGAIAVGLGFDGADHRIDGLSALPALLARWL